MSNAVGRIVFQLLPFVFLLVALYVMVRLVFLKKPPESKPGLESHGQLRE